MHYKFAQQLITVSQMPKRPSFLIYMLNVVIH